ncbi:MAG: HNH endonuclease [Bacteroidales bacterium]|nr:HNH endonuclease [Bacteroidales bacterium]
MKNDKEVWKPLYFDGLTKEQKFEISDQGRIRRTHKRTGDWQYITGSNCKGYRIFSFRAIDKGKQITKSMHRLVAETFVKQPTKRHKHVIHKDYVKHHNASDNLEWVTRDTLMEHQKANPNYKRGMVYNSKLTTDNVKEIKKALLAEDVVYARLARKFGITQTQLNRIRKGENWAHVSIDA